jgi:hypothetical protein
MSGALDHDQAVRRCPLTESGQTRCLVVKAQRSHRSHLVPIRPFPTLTPTADELGLTERRWMSPSREDPEVRGGRTGARDGADRAALAVPSRRTAMALRGLNRAASVLPMQRASVMKLVVERGEEKSYFWTSGSKLAWILAIPDSVHTT